MGYETILYDLKNNVATITLNRPEVRNALNRTAYDELAQALNSSNTNPEVRVVIITGAGKGFCSGDDVKQLMLDTSGREKQREHALRQVKAETTPAGRALIEINKPVIAAVNGPAVGWGMDLSLMCDIRIASETAKFGELFVLRGLIPDLGGVFFLPLLVGLSKAYELLYTGDVIDAAEALKIGLVSKVVPADKLMDEVGLLASRIAANPPLAVSRIKEAVRRGVGLDVDAMGEYIMNALGILFTTEDHKEGATSFVEKRMPVFKGK